MHAAEQSSLPRDRIVGIDSTDRNFDRYRCDSIENYNINYSAQNVGHHEFRYFQNPIMIMTVLLLKLIAGIYLFKQLEFKLFISSRPLHW